MLENADANSAPSCGDGRGNSSEDYLCRAAQACAAGNSVLGMHLYLAAFENAAASPGALEEGAVEGLKQAWALACRLKERSLAEYIFEKLEPYLSPDETERCAEQLQRMALDKLEEFGLSRDDLEDMADMISQDFLGMGLMQVEHVTEPSLAEGLAAAQAAWEQLCNGADDAESGAEAAGEAGRAEKAAVPDGEGAIDGTVALEGASGAKDDDAAGSPSAANKSNMAVGSKGAKKSNDSKESKNAGVSLAAGSTEKKDSARNALARAVEEAGLKVAPAAERITYANLAGYGNAIQTMRDFGVGMQDDPDFKKLVGLLNARHGLGRMPAADTLLFHSPAREDASHFMEATLGELGLPSIRMRMDENLQGMPVLCVMAQADNMPKLNSARNEILGSGALMLEDLDLWESPSPGFGDDFGGFVLAHLSRGAREAVSLIRSAVENPEVYVLASASNVEEIDPFFLDLLEPVSVVDIDYPTPEERVDVWMDIAREHPSLRGVNRSDLVRLSAGMPRFDMYMAAREAIEEAYKDGLASRRYVPVTRENLFEKLAAYQPLDSEEYRSLEEACVRDFRADLDHIDDLLK